MFTVYSLLHVHAKPTAVCDFRPMMGGALSGYTLPPVLAHTSLHCTRKQIAARAQPRPLEHEKKDRIRKSQSKGSHYPVRNCQIYIREDVANSPYVATAEKSPNCIRRLTSKYSRASCTDCIHAALGKQGSPFSREFDQSFLKICYLLVLSGHAAATAQSQRP